MTRTQIILLLSILVLAGFVGYLALRNPQPPLLPIDENHGLGADDPACIECHARDGVLPRSPNHPLGDDCLRCHGRS